MSDPQRSEFQPPPKGRFCPCNGDCHRSKHPCSFDCFGHDAEIHEHPEWFIRELPPADEWEPDNDPVAPGKTVD